MQNPYTDTTLFDSHYLIIRLFSKQKVPTDTKSMETFNNSNAIPYFPPKR